MGDFIYKNKVYYNPVDFALDRIGGLWKMPIIWRLKDRVMRYTELQKNIPHITQKMLTTSLKELEEDGFIEKKIYATVPPKTEYTITAKGKRALEIVEVIRDYGLELMKEQKLKS